MRESLVVPDSSFYICFLDDIKRPDYLLRLLNFGILRFITGRLIKDEIAQSPNYPVLKDQFKVNVDEFEYYNYGEVLRPFFSIKEIKKGEHEVIAIAYILYFLGNQLIVIIDEVQPRKFVERNFPEIFRNLNGTVGFVGNCCCEYGLFSKDEGLNILKLIEHSKFRVDKKIIDEIVVRIERC